MIARILSMKRFVFTALKNGWQWLQSELRNWNALNVERWDLHESSAFITYLVGVQKMRAIDVLYAICTAVDKGDDPELILAEDSPLMEDAREMLKPKAPYEPPMLSRMDDLVDERNYLQKKIISLEEAIERTFDDMAVLRQELATLKAKKMPVLGKPAAWLHCERPEADVITDKVKHVWDGAVVGKLAAYSIPLYLDPITKEVTDEQLDKLKAHIAELQAENTALREQVERWTGIAAEYCKGQSELQSQAERMPVCVGYISQFDADRARAKVHEKPILYSSNEKTGPYQIPIYIDPPAGKE